MTEAMFFPPPRRTPGPAAARRGGPAERPEAGGPGAGRGRCGGAATGQIRRGPPPVRARIQRICRAWGHSFARGFARVILDRVRDNLDQAPVLAIGGASWTLTLSSTSSTRPQLEEAVLNGLFP
jgi:hypothetical protein